MRLKKLGVLMVLVGVMMVSGCAASVFACRAGARCDSRLR